MPLKRCSYRKPICAEQYPPLQNVLAQGAVHLAACHFANELTLSGI
jgi:hypothetical protein